MKALRVRGREHLVVEELEMPTPSSDEVVVRMHYVGICGSDIHYYYEGSAGVFQIKEPLVLGHEVSGAVYSDPSGELPPGTAVVVAPATYGPPVKGLEQHPHLWPGGTYLGSASSTPHTQGGMQEYRVVRRSMLRRVPDGLAISQAVLAEPLSVAVHAVARAEAVEGGRVLVVGCGPIGLCVLAASQAAGAAEVHASDTSEGALSRAQRLGADATFKVGATAPLVDEYDVVFECSGTAPAVTAAFAAARRAGQVVQVGNLPNSEIAVNLAPMVSKEIAYKGSFRFHDEMEAALALLAERPEVADIVITHVVGADQAESAFALACDSERSGKVVLDIWNGATP